MICYSICLFFKKFIFRFLNWCLFELFVDVCFCGYCVGGIGGGRGRGGIGVASGERGGAIGGAGEGAERGRGRGRGQRGGRGAVRGRGSGVTRGAWRGVRERVTGRLPLLTVLRVCVCFRSVFAVVLALRALLCVAVAQPSFVHVRFAIFIRILLFLILVTGGFFFFFFACDTFCRATKRCVEFIETF